MDWEITRGQVNQVNPRSVQQLSDFGNALRILPVPLTARVLLSVETESARISTVGREICKPIDEDSHPKTFRPDLCCSRAKGIELLYATPSHETQRVLPAGMQSF